MSLRVSHHHIKSINLMQRIIMQQSFCTFFSKKGLYEITTAHVVPEGSSFAFDGQVIRHMTALCPPLIFAGDQSQGCINFSAPPNNTPTPFSENYKHIWGEPSTLGSSSDIRAVLKSHKQRESVLKRERWPQWFKHVEVKGRKHTARFFFCFVLL